MLEIPYPGLYKNIVSVTTLNDTLSGQKYSIGPGSDSFYEYLLKLWLSTGEPHYWEMYYKSAEALGGLMIKQSDSSTRAFMAELNVTDIADAGTTFTHLV